MKTESEPTPQTDTKTARFRKSIEADPHAVWDTYTNDRWEEFANRHERETDNLRVALRLAESAAVAALDERDDLARWKEEMLTVERWWGEVDAVVRKHPDAIVGHNVSDTVLRFIRERDALRWTPLTERQPAEDDSNEYHDVEWSDGKEVWQNQFTNPNIGNRKATHWRSISLPSND